MTKANVCFSADCDRSVLVGKQIGVVGFGSQGRALALNLRDSDCDVVVVLRANSTSALSVRADQLRLLPPDEISTCQIVILALPDHEQPNCYGEYIGSSSAPPQCLVHLHGLNFHFGNIAYRNDHDIILVAPHGPGADLRARYISREGLSCFLAVGRDVTGTARQTGLALADAIGAGWAGIFETTFRDETIGDLFGEQTLLVGGLAGLTDAVFRTLTGKGISPVNAYLETIRQLRLLAAQIEDYGPMGMIEKVSKTAAYGSLMAMPVLFDDMFRQRLESIYATIESGDFNRLLQAAAKNNFEDYHRLIELAKQRPSQTIIMEMKQFKPPERT